MNCFVCLWVRLSIHLSIKTSDRGLQFTTCGGYPALLCSWLILALQTINNNNSCSIVQKIKSLIILINWEIKYLLNILKKGPRRWLVTRATHIVRPALERGGKERGGERGGERDFKSRVHATDKSVNSINFDESEFK